ncbi:sensor histidine kinase [Algibacter sp.]|uniref:sensor histidine kinase n=1 Tax=Algibacter sp. TaxID=1872428 RepID=UPI003C7911FB
MLATILCSTLSFGQNSEISNNKQFKDERSSTIINLAEQVKWSEINSIATFKIGVLGTNAIANNLSNYSENKRIFDKLIEVKRISSIEEIENYNVIYVNTTFEYLLASINDFIRGKQILVISEGYPTGSSMINITKVGDSYSYDINRMYLREASLRIEPTLANRAVSTHELKEKIFEKTEQKLYVVSRENDEQKKIIESQISDINKKKEALIEKDNSIKSLFIEGELKNKEIKEKITLVKVNEQKLEQQIAQITFQQQKMDSINDKIQNQQKVLMDQSDDIKAKTEILAKKNIIIDTQRKHNIVLTILSTILFILSLSLLVAYLKNKKLNKQLQVQHIEINNQSKLLTSKNKELEQFAYITSHDLQEPLNTISSFITIIKDEYHSKFDDDGKQMLDFVKEGSIRMKKLIDALLQYSRLGRSKEYEFVQCTPLLDILTADMQNTIKSTNAKISYNDLPTIKGNEVELRLLFQNLISNGIKFRNPDTIPEIEIQCKEVCDTDDVINKEQKFWVFSVTDNGIGIAKEYQDRVFAIFQRLHSRLEYEGSGIGLAHCKKIVEAHSGKIWFTSEQGVGTTFSFSIPIEA